MTLSAAGFPGSVTDVQWSRLIDLLGYDGTDGMNVSPASGDRTVQIGDGWSNVGGVLAINDGSLTVGPLPANAGSNTRIDRIVLRANWSSKTLAAIYRQGTPSSNPQPPLLIRNPGSVYEVRLAQVVVAPGTGNLSSGDILAERVPPVSGFYNSSGFRGFPDTDIGALVWYGAANSLRIPVGGEYVEIAHARDEMLPEQAFSDSDFTYTSTTPSATASGAGTVGRTFVAPPSGMAFITVGGRIQTNINGNLALLGWEMRTGSNLGAGSIVYAANATRAIIAGESVNTGAPNVMGGSDRFLASGLSPGSSYNVRTMHWSSGSGQTSQYWSRKIIVEPV